MKFNIFEGARRISLFFGFLWVVGWLSYAIFNEPYWQSSKQLAKHADETPYQGQPLSYEEWEAKTYGSQQKAGQQAPEFDPKEYKAFLDKANDAPSEKLIEEYNAWKQTKEQQPDPKLIEEYNQWKASKEDKNDYAGKDTLQAIRDIGGGVTEGAANSNPNTSESKADNTSYKKALLKQWKEALMSLFGGLAFGWVFVASTGWIVRGFLGIPRGQDFRPNP